MKKKLPRAPRGPSEDTLEGRQQWKIAGLGKMACSSLAMGEEVWELARDWKFTRLKSAKERAW